MSDATQPLIHLNAVTKVFFTDEVETHALDGITLDIFDGEYIAIEGPSGCGKSTLLSILGLLDTPTDGNYTLNGRPVAELAQADRLRGRETERSASFSRASISSVISLCMRTSSCLSPIVE